MKKSTPNNKHLMTPNNRNKQREQSKSTMMNNSDKASLEATLIMNAQKRHSEQDTTLKIGKGEQSQGMSSTAFNIGVMPNNQNSFFSNSQSQYQNMLYNIDNQEMGKNIQNQGNPALIKQMSGGKIMYNNMGQPVGPYMQMHSMGVNGQPKMFINPPRQGNYEESPSHFCLEHRSISNLVCLTDQKIICSNCALFGIHKGHDYIKFDNFKNDCRSKLGNLQTEFEKIRFKRFLREGDKEAQFIREKVEDKKRLFFSELEALATQMVKQIRDHEAKVRKKIEGRFEQFETVIDEWSSLQMKIKDKSENLEHRLQKLGKAVGARQTDFQFLLENLYNRGGQNPMDEIIKLTNQVLKHEGTASIFVEKELGKYEIKTNELKLKETIRLDSMRLFYDGGEVDERRTGLSYLNKTSEQSIDDDEYGSQNDHKEEYDVENGIGFDLRRSINFDINKELEANAARRTPMKPQYLSAVKEKGSEEMTPLAKLRSKKAFGMDNSRNHFEENRSRTGRPSKTDNSLNYLNVSNIEKKRGVTPKINEEEVDRINVSALTDISGGMMLEKRRGNNSYTIYDAEEESNDHDEGLLETIENEDLDDAFGEDFDRRSLSEGESNILNNSLEEGHNLYGQNYNRRGTAENMTDENEENLYETNNFEDVDFMNENFEESQEPQQEYAHLLQDLKKIDSGRRGMGAPKNSIINLSRKGPAPGKKKKKKSDYNLYNNNHNERTGMKKNRNHRSNVNIHHKRTKTGLSSTGTGFLQNIVNKSQNKRKGKSRLNHTTSLGDKGLLKGSKHKTSIYEKKNTKRDKSARKNSRNNMINQKKLKLDLNNARNYQTK